MKKLIIIALTLALTSCGSTYNLSTDYKIKSILTITEVGDTLAVPVRDFKFRILDRRIRELIDRDPFRYQYRQNWYRGNYNMYPIPNYNQGYNYSKPNSSVRPKPVNPPTTIKPYKPTSPINIKPIVKPNNNKKNERK
tara:strand:- start:436 stop:849 length:414 start_codon:yes stop_codon:yes gene_type:complete